MSRRVLYTVRRVHILSTVRFGLILGALLTVVPSFVLALVLLQIVHMLRVQLETWQSINLFNAPITNQPVLVDFISLLRLTNALEVLQSLDRQAFLLVLLLTLGLTFAGGLLVAIISSLFGLFYNVMANISGGIVLELEPVSLPETRTEYSSSYKYRSRIGHEQER